MKNYQLKIGEHIARKPFVQGGMGVGISLGNLAGNVAKYGGVGTISAAQIGYQLPEFEQDAFTANVKGMELEYQKARQIAKDGVIGFNIMVALNHYKDYVKKAVKLGADFVVCGAGLPTELPAFVEKGKTAIAPIVSTEKAARILLKMWDKHYKRTADFVVIEGPKAGGHLGFHKEEAENLGQSDYDDEIHRIHNVIAEFEQKYARHIQVVHAGGIHDAKAAEHAFLLGADAIQVATDLIPTTECDANERYKERYLQVKESDIKIIQSPVGMPGRAIENEFLRNVKELGRIPVKKCYQCLKHCKPNEIPYCITDALIQAAKGNVEKGLLFSGFDIRKQEKLVSVKEVMDSLLNERIYDILKTKLE